MYFPISEHGRTERVRASLHPCILMMLGAFLTFSGCTDQLASLNDSERNPRPVHLNNPSKLRHSHLLDQAVRSVGKSGSSIGVLVALEEGSTRLTEQELLKRLELLTRYELLTRFELLSRYELLSREELLSLEELLSRWELLSRYELVGRQELLTREELLTRWELLTRDELLTRWELLSRWELLTREELLSRLELLHRDELVTREELISRWELVTREELVQRWKLLTRDEDFLSWKLLKRYADFKRVFRGSAVEIPTRLINIFAKIASHHPDVKWIEPDILLHRGRSSVPTSSVKQVEPWGLSYIGAVSGRSAGPVEVYFIDSGVNSSDINVAGRWDFTEGVGHAGGDDTDGHGTHISSLATAIDDADGIVGVAPGVKTYSLKVLRDDGTAESAYVIKALEFVMERKAVNPSTPVVVNIGLGADIGTTAYIALDDAVAAAAAAGVTVVVAAGNGGVNASTYTPAHAAEAITVGSYGKSYVFSSFSNFGNAVDVVAPGESLETVESDISTSRNRFSSSTGTSPASAIVAGAAALYLARHPSATPAQVSAALVENGKTVVSNVPPGTTTKSLWIGN